MRTPKARVTIISPALQKANNGNWQTAYRWSRFLQPAYEITLGTDWPPADDQDQPPACLIALHARRSGSAIAKFAERYPDRPLVVVLTGTDLYRDIRSDGGAQRSLDLASHLVVLQDEGLAELASSHRAKCRVIYQSAPASTPETPNRRTFDVVLVGHMRAEKDPLTPMRALELLPDYSLVRLIHIGDALESVYLHAAQTLQAHTWPTVTRYVWLGGLPHGDTRQHIKRAKALVISSVMEGGANVIIEAVTAGVPVLASRIPGNIGMLGLAYDGYFPPGDCQQLARLLDRASREPDFLSHLQQQCARRAPLFAPEHEQSEVLKLVRDALRQHQVPR
ncbi:selenoneine biosynthesis selenosugar synthase SenB [Glaciimonas immobilis]|uniref:selenoneine biosynthesis selenosugar synthase SenB n=1 Tax=Glaciimonas immobilis TaxID=728004 RepID=UPI00143C610E|nr:selenoneine biosynthesis selenosugar synthase SenB [Glaciimonas immobilis]KAF3996023.1 TIGR04348 family glycosyltransferase [Glaciimonas immobilis]